MSERSHIIDGQQDLQGKKFGLIYTKKCGWIDLGHANPDGIDGFKNQLWNKIKWEIGSNNGSEYYSIFYNQKMKKYGVTIATGDKYEIKKGLNLSQKHSVALAIFLGVSHKFENLQNSWPFTLGTDSGYSAEDLVSNLIGFYRTIYPEMDILQQCEPVSKETALEIWDKYGAVGSNKNYTSSPFLFPHPGSQNIGPVCAELPIPLNTVKPAKEGVLFRKVKQGGRRRR